MVNAGRTAAGWLAGRAILFVLALLLLVAIDISRDASSLIRTQVVALLPDSRSVADLAAKRADALGAAEGLRAQVNARLSHAHELPADQLARWLRELDGRIARLERERLDTFDLVLAANDGRALAEHARNEATLQILRHARDELRRVAALRSVALSPQQAAERVDATRQQHVEVTRRYWQSRRVFEAYATQHPLAATVPFELLGIASPERSQYLQNRGAYTATAAELRRAKQARDRAEAIARQVNRSQALLARPLAQLDPGATRAIDAAIDARSRAAAAARSTLAEVWSRARVFVLAALWIVVVLTLLPVVLKAFWYYVMAPMAARRAPIRLFPTATPTVLRDMTEPSSRISSVSLDIELTGHDELLVHPEFLQSLASPGRKSTQWLLNPAYPIVSLASGMVALTCIRGAGHAYTVSSRKDPLAEVGLIDLPDGARFVLQPRHLVGIVQPRDRPVRISSHWNFGLTAWITLQFRYLVFHGPGRLIVSGCRGVRLEPAGAGRSIDQAATVGFSANLDYVPRRSATFGAYLIGVNGLFDDGFAGGPGIYVYEEMPYYGKRSGITGRGLEGVTDVVLQAFGI